MSKRHGRLRRRGRKPRLYPDRFFHLKPKPRAGRARDWATARDMAELMLDPYLASRNLLPGHYRTIAEYRAINVLSAHWAALPYAIKWLEIYAWRKIRDYPMFVPHCLTARLVIAALAQDVAYPLQYIATATPSELVALESYALRASNRQQIRKLKQERRVITRKIKQLA